MPSHCSTDCNVTKYQTKKVDVTDEEYRTIKQTLEKIKDEEKDNKKKALEKLLKDTEEKINNIDSQLKDLNRQYTQLSEECKKYEG